MGQLQLTSAENESHDLALRSRCELKLYLPHLRNSLSGGEAVDCPGVGNGTREDILGTSGLDSIQRGLRPDSLQLRLLFFESFGAARSLRTRFRTAA